MTILVVGGTGLTASAVRTELATIGADVRVLTRSAERAAELASSGVAALAASFDDPRSLRAAFDGVQAAYLATASSPDLATVEVAFARAAMEAGAHLVKLSTLGADPDSSLRFGRMHAEAEAAIASVGGRWTFLQPNGFMQNDLVWAGQVPDGAIAGPVMDAAWSIVDARDIAAVAAAVLTDPAGHSGQRIRITGPEAMTPRERVAGLGETLGRDLTVIDVPVLTVAEQLRGYGVPDWQVGGLVELFELYSTGNAAAVAPDASTILQRPTRSWGTFVADHAASFTG